MSSDGGVNKARLCDAGKWASIAAEMRDALDSMESLVAQNCVDTDVKDKDGKEVSGRGWGVWVQPPRINGDKRDGQFGILGTSAGLELMLSTRDFRNDIAKKERRDLIMGSWRYLKACLEKGPSALDGSADSADDGNQDYRRTLLVRQCQVLRCLSALHHHESALEQSSAQRPYLAGNADLVDQILAELQACREPVELSDYPRLDTIRPGADSLTVFRFSSEPWGTDENQQTRPETPIEWAYLWGSVLVCLTRCFIAYFITAEQFRDLIDSEDVDLLSRWAAQAANSDDPDELRVGLFAGWAVMQLEQIYSDDPERTLANLHTGGTGRIVDPSQGHMPPRASPREMSKLRGALRHAAKQVIKEPALRSDLHHPYSFHIKLDKEKGPDRFRQDHLVVPTLPIALWLAAQLDSRALFDIRVRTAAKGLASAFDPAAVNRVAPGQSSTYNGTVNMNYIHEAVAEIHDLAVRTQAHSRAWRRRAQLRKPWPRLHAVVSSPWSPIWFGLLLLIIGPLIAVVWAGLGVHPSEPREKIIVAPVQ